MKRPLIIFHANCYDGFTAAWIAKKAFERSGIECGIHAASYGTRPPTVGELAGRAVHIIDFSYPREEMIDIARACDSLVVLDHHKTAEAALANIESEPGLEGARILFDMNRSGAGLAWEFYNPAVPMPDWIAAVEDRDLWRFDLPCTAEIHAALASYSMTWDNWEAINEKSTHSLVNEGTAIARYIDVYCEKASQEVRHVEWDGLHWAVVNVPYQNASEMATWLMRRVGCDASIAYFQRSDARWQFSLRSRPRGDDEGRDVSEVAKRHGGGGHRNAAGFDLENLPVEFLS